MRSLSILAAVVLATGAWPDPEKGLAEAGSSAEGAHDERSLGTVEFPISCAPEAQEEFERGVALLHHMMYVEAGKTFRSLAEAHPECAMARWGVAMTLFQPLWPTRPSPEALAEGWEAVQAARALAPGDEREQAFIAAVEAFFQDPESGDYWARIRRFEEASERVYRAYPEDREAAAFYALAHLATAGQAEEPSVHNAEAAEILLAIYDEEPTHPGAVHYTIHANDIDSRAGESLEVVRSYDDIAPGVPHALHMPTHIFVRLGEWDEVIRWNEKSADAALKFPAGDRVSHHYPHALDYLLYAHLQRAEDERAREILAAAQSKDGYQPSFISAFHLAAMPARYAVERRQWADAAALAERSPESIPWDEFPWPVAMNQFARGLGAARGGDPEGAREAIEKLARQEAQAQEAGEEYFATQIEISRLAVEAWAAHAGGESAKALELMRASAELEASTQKHPVTPGAILPSYELLGDLHAELGQPGEALAAYEASLQAWPGRFNSLLGAARAAAAAGDDTRARSYYSSLLELASEPGSARPELEEARAFVGAA
ncbi:MAG: hypothetical protein R3325_04195 [Thermoanaerobaculia bacterium]|nr:hypothetical protein [Thermoanaerobaculia bacterium]